MSTFTVKKLLGHWKSEKLYVFVGNSSHLVLVLVGTHSLVLDYWYFQVGVCGCQSSTHWATLQLIPSPLLTGGSSGRR